VLFLKFVAENRAFWYCVIRVCVESVVSSNELFQRVPALQYLPTPSSVKIH